MRIRSATLTDLPTLRDIYADAVLSAAPTAYTAAQIAVWSAFARQDAFSDFISDVKTYVAEKGSAIVGFCGIAADGHIASVYVRGGWHRQGVGLALLKFVLKEHATPYSGRYTAEASVFSRPLFECCGFRQVGTEHVVREGVPFERFLMERSVDER